MSARELNDQIDQRYGSPDDFVARVKKTIWAHDIPVTSLAEEAGYDLGNVSRWLNLRVTPSLKTMLVLDEALERLLEDL